MFVLGRKVRGDFQNTVCIAFFPKYAASQLLPFRHKRRLFHYRLLVLNCVK